MLEPHMSGRQRPLEPIYTHSRTRTTSSNTFPMQIQQPTMTMQMQMNLPPQQQPMTMAQYPGAGYPSGGYSGGGYSGGGYPSGGYSGGGYPSSGYPGGGYPNGGGMVPNRRSPSVNTFNSVSSSGMVPPAAYRTSPTTDLHRSGSNHSATGSTGGGGGGSGSSYSSTSYVALLRKQKATVWSDRAQPEDPRMAAAQRAARMRAHLEVIGPAGGLGGAASSAAGGSLYTASGGAVPGGRTATGLSSAGGKVAAKIRHHGKPGVVGYSPDSNYAGVAGVPLRLSATEVEGEDSDDEDGVVAAAATAAAAAAAGLPAQSRIAHHRRTGSSGRSSTASGRRVQGGGSTPTQGGGGGLAYRTSGRLGSLGSQGFAAGSGTRRSPGDTPERSGSLVDNSGGAPDGRVMAGLGLASYGSANPVLGPVDDETATVDTTTTIITTTTHKKADSIGSGSSGERADVVADLGGPGGSGGAASRSAALAQQQREKNSARKNVDELKRRGSVDERTMTLTGAAGRLFIANPD